MSAPIIAAWYDYTGSLLRNSVMTRRFTMPNDWQKIRVGVLVSWTTGSAANMAGFPVFSFGLCAGTTASFGDATTDHYLGLWLSSSTWTYISSPESNNPLGS